MAERRNSCKGATQLDRMNSYRHSVPSHIFDESRRYAIGFASCGFSSCGASMAIVTVQRTLHSYSVLSNIFSLRESGHRKGAEGPRLPAGEPHCYVRKTGVALHMTRVSRAKPSRTHLGRAKRLRWPMPS